MLVHTHKCTRRVGRGAARSRRLHLPPLQASLPTYSHHVRGMWGGNSLGLVLERPSPEIRHESGAARTCGRRGGLARRTHSGCVWAKGDVPAMPCDGCQPGFIRRCLVQRVCLSLYSYAASHDFSFQFHELCRAAYSCLLR